jgi:hypothetical protein
VKICSEAIQTLDAHSHGSRFYNVKQFRNACTRQLARLGHYTEALTVFENSFPLHHQDWACPNREGLLLVLIGRLEFLSGDDSKGLTTLQRSINASLLFLTQIDEAEQGLITTPKPPMMKMIGPKTPNGHSNKHNATHLPQKDPQKHPQKHPQNRPQNRPLKEDSKER